MVPGIAPKEASERLVISQGRFDELWRKYITYSGKQETLYIDGALRRGKCYRYNVILLERQTFQFHLKFSC